MLVIVAPGQGSQRPGFLAPWLQHPAYARLLTAYGDRVGLDVEHLGVAAGEEALVDTAVVQPLLVAAGLAAGRLLWPDGESITGVTAVAGHSVGELTVAALAGAVTDEEVLGLATVRGTAMADASARTATGMAAVVGGDADEVRTALRRHGLTVATVNGAGQVVAGGTLEQLDALAADPPARSRLVRLPVAGAFHTDHMESASIDVRRAAERMLWRDPAVPFVSGGDGNALRWGPAVRDAVVAQVVKPVRWDRCLDTFRSLGVTGVLELPPAGTLTAIARRALPEAEVLALDGPDRLVAARDFAARHLAR